MIKLIIGNKGSGKTKRLVELTNDAVKNSSGNVVCVEKGMKLTYDIDHHARLIESDAFKIEGFDAFYGFLTGILAGNYDITDLFIDGTFKIGGRDYAAFGEMVKKLDNITKDGGANITFTVSCDISELPEDIKGYAI
ncbi:MAG: hypothetical protein DBX66_05790 [Clostridiales bacterium]|uniref:Twitching motility protein PilT n=1 Tax=Harryflintia acetispora TaxID=1849041 RepID=A0A9X8UGH6_9FIRM|nr:MULTISPECIES: hypothetical protein [Oscillospiraceae]PWM37068.1 MAG: hypothetical protein DBX66_05790 [Clostridiales bacterium]RGB64776.1 hypothetical protein DW086_11705 [Harryflintia acetispora]TCL41012.1 hypothetical protein EDD78_11610 [Harryflintia acetispora]